MRRVHREDIWMVGVAALIGICACGSVQGLCFGIPTEDRGRPQPGTPRAGYCGPIDHWYRWLMFPALTILVSLVVSLVIARAPRRRWITLGLLTLLALANLVVVDSLDYYVAI